MANAAPSVANLSANQTLGGEERHLGVVRDGAESPVRGRKFLDARRTKRTPNVLERHEFDGCAQGVPDCSAQEATPDAVDAARLVFLQRRWPCRRGCERHDSLIQPSIVTLRIPDASLEEHPVTFSRRPRSRIA
jgi:hypothetical protein